MKIVEEFDEEGVSLLTIAVGDLFSYDGSYYMKGDDPNNLMNWQEENQNDCPAVDMATGCIRWVKRDIKVPPIYARIRINGRAD